MGKDREKKDTKQKGYHKNRRARQLMLTGSPLRVGGELLSHALAQYHRRGGA